MPQFFVFETSMKPLSCRLIVILLAATVACAQQTPTPADEPSQPVDQAASTADLHQAALAQYRQGSTKEAFELLSTAVAAANADRLLVLNFAAISLEVDQPLAGLTAATDYLKSHPQTVDEAVLNATGTLLVRATQQQADASELEAAGAVFMQKQAQLEHTRPGMKRWGTRWISPQEYRERSTSSVPEFPATLELVEVNPADAPPPARSPISRTDDAEAIRRTPDAAARTRPESSLAVPIAGDLLLTTAASVEPGGTLSIESSAGVIQPVHLLRIDRQSGLALLRLPGGRMPFLNLADSLKAAPIECVAVTESTLFQMTPKTIAATASPPQRGQKWNIDLQTSPRLAGSPLIQDGQMVGIPLDALTTHVTAAALDDVRIFIGSDLPPAPSYITMTPAACVYQLRRNSAKAAGR